MSLIHGQDPSGYLKPLLVDASGNVILSQPVQVQGTNSDKLLSYSATLLARASNLDLPAGTTTFDVFTCPANYVYHFGNVGAVYIGTVATVNLQVYIYNGVTNITLQVWYNLTTAEWNFARVDAYMEAGHVLRCQVQNATLHDDVYFDIAGFSFHTT